MRFPALICLVLLSLTACRERTSALPQQDAGPVCGDLEKLVDGECRFVCSRDGDCAAGERCNLFVGRCEPKPPEPDAGVIVQTCTEGAVRCAAVAAAIERCGADGRWTVDQTCPAGGFCQNERCLACRPSEATCVAASPATVTVCRDDGSGTRQIACAGAGTCAMGECRECMPNSTRCSPDGRSLQTCQKQGDETLSWRWVNSGDDFDSTCITDVCEIGAAGAPQCRAPACFPGQTRCVSAQIQATCSATGAFVNTPCASLPGMGPMAECTNGVCFDECADAVAAKSYFGCEFWSAIQDNSVDAYFKGGTLSGQGALNAISDFAFVVANRSSSPATVEVWRSFGGQPQRVAQVTVDGRNGATKGLRVIKVPWQSIGPASAAIGISQSGLARYGYRVTSTKPISLYQFNPLEAAKSEGGCTAAVGSRDCACNRYSEFDAFACLLGDRSSAGTCTAGAAGARVCTYNTFSNDASLLLPSHILTRNYVAITQEHSIFAVNATAAPGGDGNGHLTIVATQDATQVTVRSSAVTAAGGGVAAFAKGASRDFTLNSFDVLQLASANLGQTPYLECSPNPFGGSSVVCRVDNDLSGTVITASKPIAVFGGSNCTSFPYDRVACDHVEEQIFPFETWGKSFVAVQTKAYRTVNQSVPTAPQAPNHYKIVAGCPASQCPNGTLLTLTPPPNAADILRPNNATATTRCLPGTSLMANNCRLPGSATVEFKSSRDFTVVADQPIAVAQFFPGQGPGGTAPTSPIQGDPSMVLLPPSEQWRSSYTLLAAPGTRDNYLAIAIDGSKVASVNVDGVAVASFTSIAGSPFLTANVAISEGTHTVDVQSRPGVNPLPGAGVVVYGYDAYVSYGYTGGLDLGAIVTGINPGG